MINILHIAFKHNKDDMRIFQKECTSLAKNNDYCVTYITSDINSEIGDDIVNGVNRVVIPAYSKRIIKALIHNRRIKRFIKERGNINLIHLHEPTLLFIARWAKRRGIHVIFDSHEDYGYQLKVNHNKLLSKAYKIYERFVCSRIDGVIFPCKMEGKQPFDYKVNRLVYIDNYPIVDDIPVIKKKQEFIACYTGSLSVDRGVRNSVEAWHKADVRGIIAGKFSSKSQREIIESTQGYNNVEYKGFLEPSEVSSVYEKASVGMALLRNVGQYHICRNLPTKVGEYMLYGLPTIIYTTSFIKDIMKDYEFGIMVNPDNTDEIAKALKFLKNNPQKAESMGQEGVRAVKEKFNWETQEVLLYRLYSDIIIAK